MQASQKWADCQPESWALSMRPYQDTACAAVTDLLDAGRVVCLVAPTGAGKTRMARKILAHPSVRAPLALTHTTVLREQTIRNVPGVKSCTIQSLIAEGPLGDARRAALANHDAFFIDECHHIVGAEWRAVMPFLRHGRILGVTATPERADGTPLGDVFDAMVPAAKYSELVRDGYLVPCDILSPEIKRAAQRKKKVRPDGVKAYLEHCRDATGRLRPGIYFDSTIALCESAVEQLNAAGLRAALVCHETGNRQEIFDAYDRGDIDILCSPMALAEGFDAPRAEVCVLRRTCSSVALYLQICGRILRPAPGKERALLIDICDASSMPSHGAPTDDRVYSLTGKGIALEPVPVDEDEEKEPGDPIEREGYQTVEVKYELIRDNLRDQFRNIQMFAKENQRAPGWVFYRFKEATGLEVPRRYEAKFQSICKCCRRRMKVGQPMLWDGPGKVYHEECWFETLSPEQLAAVDRLSPNRVLSDADAPVPPQPTPQPAIAAGDWCPF